MHCFRSLIIVLLTMAAISISGCKSKQERTGTGAAKSGADAAKAVAPPASPQEKAAARTAASAVLAKFEAGDFSAIYKGSAPGFKQIGSEDQFVAKFQQTRQKVGVLKNPKEISYDTRPDNYHVLVYRLENDQYTTDMRLTFARTKDGKMELAGLNQHDELKK